MAMLSDVVPRSKIAKIVAQGDHKSRITQLFMMVRQEMDREFTEDNQATRDAFLQECFDNSRYQ